MKKEVMGDDAFYIIEWSEFYPYERIMASRILPDMPGIIHFADNSGSVQKDLLLFASWREGLRSGMKNLFDPLFSTMPKIREDLESRKISYRYAVIDTSPFDMQDIFFWLIRSYTPLYNNVAGYADSKRYRDISVREVGIGLAKHVPGFKR